MFIKPILIKKSFLRMGLHIFVNPSLRRQKQIMSLRADEAT
jgi:hypothetical protein